MTELRSKTQEAKITRAKRRTAQKMLAGETRSPIETVATRERGGMEAIFRELHARKISHRPH